MKASVIMVRLISTLTLIACSAQATSVSGLSSSLSSSAPNERGFTPFPTLTKMSLTELPQREPMISNQVDGAELVYIAEGMFEMGAAPEEGLKICQLFSTSCSLVDFSDESPAHMVELDAFWIYKNEVTNSQYRLCVKEGVCQPPALPEFFLGDRFSGHPVVYVDWFSAATYCDWAGGRQPTEAEWEKAARGSDGRSFPWGNAPDCGLGNIKGCNQGLTMPAGSFKDGASPYGVLDMAGNVSEWVADWYSAEYYQESPTLNPTGPAIGEMRVARGGSWKNPIPGVRSTNRTANFPDVFSTGVGFRCIIDEGN